MQAAFIMAIHHDVGGLFTHLALEPNSVCLLRFLPRPPKPCVLTSHAACPLALPCARTHTHTHCPARAHIDLQAPEDADVRAKWYEELKKPLSNGCGHIRLMLQSSGNPPPTSPPAAAAGYTVPFYSFTTGSGALASCDPDTAPAGTCINSKAVMGEVIDRFFK
jgi:hypothetical protein